MYVYKGIQLEEIHLFSLIIFKILMQVFKKNWRSVVFVFCFGSINEKLENVYNFFWAAS